MKKQMTALTVWVDVGMKSEIERLAARLGITPSKLARNLLVVGVDEVRNMEKLGVLQVSVLVRDTRERVREFLEIEGKKLREQMVEA